MLWRRLPNTLNAFKLLKFSKRKVLFKYFKLFEEINKTWSVFSHFSILKLNSVNIVSLKSSHSKLMNLLNMLWFGVPTKLPDTSIFLIDALKSCIISAPFSISMRLAANVFQVAKLCSLQCISYLSYDEGKIASSLLFQTARNFLLSLFMDSSSTFLHEIYIETSSIVEMLLQLNPWIGCSNPRIPKCLISQRFF